MKKLVLSICVGFFLAMGLCAFTVDTSERLSSGIIRLHVRANSNSNEDQALKLKVRDRLLAEAKTLSPDGMSTENTKKIVANSLEHIAKISREELLKNGCTYPVRVSFGKSDFPLKTYGEMTLPAGTYEAVTVEIGSGKGDNWWCVMFPPLCFTEETFASIPEESEEILIENLGNDTYSMIKSKKPKIKLKLYEMLKRGIDKDK